MGEYMKILFYRYGSICEPDLIECFRAAGIEVHENNVQISQKKIKPSDIVAQLSDEFTKETYMFVFSINFFPAVSDVCQIYNIPYICWTVDSPVLELFSPSLSNSVNRVFFFDRAQFEYFGKGKDNCFYMPLATNVSRWQKVIGSATENDKRKFSSDISMVGSLYLEKNPYRKIQGLTERTKGFVEGLINSQMQIYGYNFLEQTLTKEVMDDFVKCVPDLTVGAYSEFISKEYVMANSFIGIEIACRERIEYLNELSKIGKTSLYTFSDTSDLNNINVIQGAKTLTEMPIIFNNSKINLNFTIRPIQTGLSLRVYDVLGCAGFLMTNYQSELPEIFDIGEDLECFSSKEELIDKTKYYLEHEDVRAKIAKNGYEKVANAHTYEYRFADMIKLIYATL